MPLADVDCLSDDDDAGLVQAKPPQVATGDAVAVHAPTRVMPGDRSIISIEKICELRRELAKIVISSCPCSSKTRSRRSCFAAFQEQVVFDRVLDLRKLLVSTRKEDSDKKVLLSQK